MANVARTRTQNATGQDENRVQQLSHAGMSAGEAAVEYFKEYARERPEIVTMWAFGVGFVLGWKLRIW